MGTKTFANLRSEIGRLGHWNVSSSSSTSYAAANAAAEAALQELNGLVLGGVDLWWLEVETHFTLASDLASGYKLTLPARALRIKTRSFHYGGSIASYLLWRPLQWIDNKLGPQWRTASGTTGAPRYICQVAGELWVAPQPSASHIASNPYLYYGYFQGEDAADAALILPDPFFPCAVHAGLKEGLKQKDDSDADYYHRLWNDVDVPRLRSATPHIGADDRLLGTELGEDLGYGYGYAASEDGYY